MTLTPGTRLDQYEVLAPLGAGGMGEVYRARDTRLGRDVAIKVLPERLAKDPDALARFEREAKALAALSHSNILTIFDFGTDHDVHYAVMELLEGETLRTRMRTTKMVWNKILEIGAAICEGLVAAHSRGIIHRDLKPENIFITASGSVKILDFGLARVDNTVAADQKSALATVSETQPGTVLGTIGYMSPEQVRGQSLDTRSDIFSLGCILYEMATAKSPFARNTAADTMAAILNSDPPELSTSGNTIPPEMERVILHCLEKDRDNRFQTARDLSFDLKEIASGIRMTKPMKPDSSRAFPAARLLALLLLIACLAGGVWWYLERKGVSESNVRIPVAVADFINETGEKDLDGLSGMLITSLEQSRKLAVMTRSRMLDEIRQMGKGSPDKIDEQTGREVCKRAGVSALIIASIRKFDQLYAMDLKVLDPQKNEYLFTTKQQGTGKSSVPDLIDRLSEETRIGLKEKEGEIQVATRKVVEVTTSNLEAYQYYFQGEELISKLEFEKAEAEFQKAVAIDPEFALAYARLAYAVSWTSIERAREPLQQALRRLDRLPEKYRLYLTAVKAYVDHNLDEAFKLLSQTLTLYPDDKEALFTMGDFRYHHGQPAEAEVYFKKVLALDPAFERALQHLIWLYSAQGETDRAVEAARSYVDKAKSQESLYQLFRAYIASGNYNEAEKTLNEAEKIAPSHSEISWGKSELFRFKQEYSKAEAECRGLLVDGRPEKDQIEGFGCLSNFYVFTGQYEKAAEAKQREIELGQKLGENDEIANHYADLAYIYFWGLGDRSKGEEVLDLAFENVRIDSVHVVFDMLCLFGRNEQAQQVAKNRLWGHRPFLDESLRAFAKYNAKDYTGAAKEFEFLAEHGYGFDRPFARYMLAQCYKSLGDHDLEIKAYLRFVELPLSKTGWEYPRAIYELAGLYDRKGDRATATKYYGEFLELWKEADPRRPELAAARKRLQ